MANEKKKRQRGKPLSSSTSKPESGNAVSRQLRPLGLQKRRKNYASKERDEKEGIAEEKWKMQLDPRWLGHHVYH